MAYLPFVPGTGAGEIEQIKLTDSMVRVAYVSAFNVVDMIYFTNQAAEAYRLNEFSHMQTADLNIWHTYCGYRLTNRQNPLDKSHYLIFQYKPSQIVSETSYGYTEQIVYGEYRWCIAFINSNDQVTIQTVLYTGITTNLRAKDFTNAPSHNGIRRISFHEAVVFGSLEGVGAYIGVLPSADIEYNDATVEYTAGITGSSKFAIPLSMIPSTYDPLPKKVTDPNEQEGTSGEGGGTGDHDDESDPNPKPSLTGLNDYGAMNAGFVTLYKVTMAQLQTLADELMDPTAWQAVENWFNKPQDMIAGLMLLPFQVHTGATYYPKIGLHTFNISMPIVDVQYYEIDCGEINIKEFYGGCFDYSPYTQLDLFIPMCGTRSLDVDEVMGKYLGVTYHIDCMNGDFVAFVTTRTPGSSSKDVKYQFSGSCGQQIAITTSDFSQVINQAITFATAAVASIATAGAAGAAAGAAAAEAGAATAEAAAVGEAAQAAATVKAAADLGASAVSAVMNGKPRVERTGCLGGSIGHMSILKPYIIKKVPRQSLPVNYAKYNGYPANISGTVGSFTGFTVFEQVRLENIAATDPELAEIQNILRGGVIL